MPKGKGSSCPSCQSYLKGNQARSIIQESFTLKDIGHALRKLNRSEREAKATKSVGPSAAPTAKQAAKGRLSQRRWAKPPKLRVEMKITGNMEINNDSPVF